MGAIRGERKREGGVKEGREREREQPVGEKNHEERGVGGEVVDPSPPRGAGGSRGEATWRAIRACGSAVGGFHHCFLLRIGGENDFYR
jgi:hypothetical protein